MRIVIFGTGVFYRRRKEILGENAEIVAFIDNDKETWGTQIDGALVMEPEQISRLHYDKILLMSDKSYEMREQLLSLGVSKEKIMYYEDFCSIKKGMIKVFFDKIEAHENRKKVLVISSYLGYNGGSMTAVYAAQALNQKGYQAVLAAPDADEKFIKETTKNGLIILLYGNLSCIGYDELFWIREFDSVIVNTFTMVGCACMVNRIKKVVWWLHESDIIYRGELPKHPNIAEDELSGLKILAVSDVAKRNFKRYFPKLPIDVLNYGIPDQYEYVLEEDNSGKTIFAIIGVVSYIKGHDLLIDAIKKMEPREKENSEFWIIGNISPSSGFGRQIELMRSEEPSIKLLGERNREEMESLYKKISVVVNPSRQDCLPISVVEGMMYGKVCITSDATGISSWIKDGDNGFVFKTEDSDDLYSKIKRILTQKACLKDIGKKARGIYEDHFTMSRFGENLEKVIK